MYRTKRNIEEGGPRILWATCRVEGDIRAWDGIQKSETSNVETLAVAKLRSMGKAVSVPLQINGSPI